MNRLLSILLLLLLTFTASAANLVPNSGFELGLRKGWVYYGAQTITASIEAQASTGEAQGPWEVITTNSHSGSAAFKFPNTGMIYSRPMWLTNGSVYTCSAWIKAASADAGKVKYGMIAAASLGNDTLLANSITTTTDYSRYSYQFTAPSNGLYSFGLSWYSGQGTTFYPQVDDVQVELAGTASDWAPQQTVEAGLVLTNYSSALFSGDTKAIKLRFYNTGTSVSRVYEVRIFDDYNTCWQTNLATVSVPNGVSDVTITLPSRNGWLRAVSRLDLPDSWDETGISVLPFSSTWAAGVGTNGVLGGHIPASTYFANKYKGLFPWSRNLSPGMQQTRWTYIEASSNTWTWHDAQVAAVATNSMFILGQLTPGLDGEWNTWATNVDGSLNESAFTNYVYQVVNRYGANGTGQIKYWEVLNEPYQFGTRTSTTNRPTISAYYIATNYARLLSSSVAAITNADPAACVVGIAGVGGLGSGGAAWAYEVWTNLTADIQSKIPFVSYHLYPGTNPPNTDDRTDDHEGWYQEWRDTWSGVRPFWNTESAQYGFGNLRTHNTLFPGYYNLTATASPEAARGDNQYRQRMVIDSMARTFLRSIGYGFSKYFYYENRFFNSNHHTSSEAGTDEWDDSLRPHGVALSIGSWLIDNAQGLGPITNTASSAVEAMWFVGRDGRAAVAAWVPGGGLRTLTTTNGSFALFDHWGNQLQTNSTTVELTRTPRYLISHTLTTNQLKETFVNASVATPSDTAAPNITIDIAPTGAWADGQFQLAKWHAADNTLVPYSAITAEATNIVYRWKLNSGSWSDYSQSNHVWLTGLSAGDNTLYVTALDANGNSSTVTYPFIPAAPETPQASSEGGTAVTGGAWTGGTVQ